MKIKEIDIFDEYATVWKETVLEAAKIMKEKNVPDLILIDENDKPLGIISAVDIIVKVVAEEKDPKEIAISSISRKVKAFNENATIEEIFEYMINTDNEIVPIIRENGKLFGVCTIGDVLLKVREAEE